jgi:hypothetical protein
VDFEGELPVEVLFVYTRIIFLRHDDLRCYVELIHTWVLFVRCPTSFHHATASGLARIDEA